MAGCANFSVVKLPALSWNVEDEEHVRLALKLENFRLHALQTSPEAFASSYETEKGRSVDHILERLQHSKATRFYALQLQESDNRHSEAKSELEQVCRSHLAGVLILLGPEDDGSDAVVSAGRDPFARMTAPASKRNGDASKDNSHASLHFHLNGMFVDTPARGQGLGLQLIRTAIDTAKKQGTQSDRKLRISISVDSENVAAHRLYEKAGFTVKAQEPYTQRPRLVGGEMKSVERIALNMEMQTTL